MPDDPKKAALIAEGMTEGEADYIVSGGTKSEGLTPPAADGAAPATAAAAAPAAATGAAAAADGAAPGAAGVAAAAPAADEDDGPEPPKDSPFYQQWHREKRRRQHLQTELRTRDDRLAERDTKIADLEQKWARLDERLSVFRQASEPAPVVVQPKPKPDREADPFGYMEWLEERIEGLAPKLDEVTSQVQERDAATELQNSYISDARTFARVTPEFGQAYNWLMANRDAELAAAGYGDKQERLRIITLDERDIVARALKAKQDNPQAPGPAQIIFNLAKARGFTAARPAANAQQQAAPGAATPANGAPPAANGAAPAANGAAATSVTQQVESIQRGQAASRSLSSAGGSPAPQGIDLARIADMSDTEYLDWKRTLTPAQVREYGGLIGAPGR